MSTITDGKLAESIRQAFPGERFTVDAEGSRVWLGMKFERPATRCVKAGYSTASTSGFARKDKRKRVTEEDVALWIDQAIAHLGGEIPKYHEKAAEQARELLAELEAHRRHRL